MSRLTQSCWDFVQIKKKTKAHYIFYSPHCWETWRVVAQRKINTNPMKGEETENETQASWFQFVMFLCSLNNDLWVSVWEDYHCTLQRPQSQSVKLVFISLLPPFVNRRSVKQWKEWFGNLLFSIFLSYLETFDFPSFNVTRGVAVSAQMERTQQQKPTIKGRFNILCTCGTLLTHVFLSVALKQEYCDLI